MPLGTRTLYTLTPLNVGSAPGVAHTTFITPTDDFFVRSHAANPDIDLNAYRLHVDGLVATPLALSLEALRGQFREVTITATLQCAGNRRNELTALQAIDASEIVWRNDAIGNATWTGVRLADVLAVAGVREGAAHVAFEGLDAVEKDGAVFGFGGSVPLAQALHEDVLLAYAMNGALLLPDHGFPLRVLAPGTIGARSVKWVGRVTVQDAPSRNYFQQKTYKWFPPSVTSVDDADPADGVMLNTLPLNATMVAPVPGAVLPAGAVVLRGTALSGHRPVTHVEVSADDGATWHPAQINARGGRWAWVLWEATLTLGPGQHTLTVRATDAAGHTQPTNMEAVWNVKGYVNNALQRVPVTMVEA